MIAAATDHITACDGLTLFGDEAGFGISVMLRLRYTVRNVLSGFIGCLKPHAFACRKLAPYYARPVRAAGHAGMSSRASPVWGPLRRAHRAHMQLNAFIRARAWRMLES
jgi:hypothetical protein